MGDFDKAMNIIIDKNHEGGFQKNPRDPGNWRGDKLVGTKFGIAAAYHPDVDIENLTIEEAKAILKEEYWDESICERLPDGLANAYFDTIINMGVSGGAKVLQRAINSVIATTEDGIVVDGITGPQTLKALEFILRWSSKGHFVQVFTLERIRSYVYGRQTNYDTLLSWIRRSLNYVE